MPRLIDPDQVEGAQRLDHHDDEHDHVDRPHDREDDPEEGLPLGGAVDGGRLAQGAVDALQAGQVDQHDVAGVPPRGGDEHRPEVDVGVAVPVDLGAEAPG